MPAKRHSAEQIVRKLREAEVELARGATVKDAPHLRDYDIDSVRRSGAAGRPGTIISARPGQNRGSRIAQDARFGPRPPTGRTPASRARRASQGRW